MIDYHSFSFLKLCRIFLDEDKHEDFGVSKEDWENIKAQYTESNPSPETFAVMESYQEALKASVDFNRHIALLTFLLANDVDWKPYFKATGLKYTGDNETDSKYLSKQLEKLETKNQIMTARLQKLQKEIEQSRKDSPTEPMTIKKAYKALAVLEKQGASIPDYEKFTCGQYDAFIEIIQEENGKGNNNWR